MENYERLSDMNDLGNSFKFDNNHAFDGFNKKENKKDDSEHEAELIEPENDQVADEPAPLELNNKERKVLTNWLDAEYSSAFLYKKVKLNYSHYVSSPINKNKDIDINDPIVVYEFLKKYTNILYDYDCDSETEKTVVNALEAELKEYYLKHSTDGLEEFLDKKFRELKEKYLVIKPDEIPAEKISKMLFIKEY